MIMTESDLIVSPKPILIISLALSVRPLTPAKSRRLWGPPKRPPVPQVVLDFVVRKDEGWSRAWNSRTETQNFAVLSRAVQKMYLDAIWLV